MSSDGDKVEALAAIYTGTRADNSSIMNVGLALLGAGVTYIAATLAFADAFGTDVDWIIVAVLPAPLWIVAAFHSLIVSITMVNAVTAQYVEARLMDVAGVGNPDRRYIGYQRAEMIMNIGKSRWSHKVMVVLTYGGAATLVLGYTVYMTWLYWTNDDNVFGTMLFTAFYTAATISVIFSWWHGVSHGKESESAVLPPTTPR